MPDFTAIEAALSRFEAAAARAVDTITHPAAAAELDAANAKIADLTARLDAALSQLEAVLPPAAEAAPVEQPVPEQPIAA